MKAGIIAIGDEVVSGDVVDTNTLYISRKLTTSGYTVKLRIQVPDQREGIIRALDYSLPRVDLLVITGGLGPTGDDITTCVIAEYFGFECMQSEKGYMLLKGAEEIENDVGMIPGMLIKIDNRELLLMPGVPEEMKNIFDRFISRIFTSSTPHLTFRTCGITERMLHEILSSVFQDMKGFHFYPSWRGVDLKIMPDNPEEIQNIRERVIGAIEDYVYAEEDIEIEEVVGKMLRKGGYTISVAESCTGGLVASLITDVPGSSDYFMGGITAYSNDAKIKLLNVSPENIKKYGAVSEQVAEEMAEGVAKVFKTDIGISTTGIAGPTGGTPEKPVGLVYMGVHINGETIVERRVFRPPRGRVKIESSTYLLFMLYRRLKKK